MVTHADSRVKVMDFLAGQTAFFRFLSPQRKTEKSGLVSETIIIIY